MAGRAFHETTQKCVKAVFLLGCYGCIFHGTRNLAQLCQNFGISGGGLNTPTQPNPHPPPSQYATGSLHILSFSVSILLWALSGIVPTNLLIYTIQTNILPNGATFCAEISVSDFCEDMQESPTVADLGNCDMQSHWQIKLMSRCMHRMSFPFSFIQDYSQNEVRKPTVWICSKFRAWVCPVFVHGTPYCLNDFRRPQNGRKQSANSGFCCLTVASWKSDLFCLVPSGTIS